MNEESKLNSSQTNSTPPREEPFVPLQYMVQIQRVIAWVFDVALVFLFPMLAIIRSIVEELDVVGYPLFLQYINFLFLFVYLIYCEHRWGQTLGKKIMGIKVFMEDGSHCTLRAATIRNLALIPLMFLPILQLVDLFLVYKTRKKQRIGDFLAHTVVVDVVRKYLRQSPYSETVT